MFACMYQSNNLCLCKGVFECLYVCCVARDGPTVSTTVNAATGHERLNTARMSYDLSITLYYVAMLFLWLFFCLN